MKSKIKFSRPMGIFIFLAILMAVTTCTNSDYPYFLKRSEHGMLWVANSLDNTVTCIDRIADEIVGTYRVGSNPSRTAVDLDGNCWVGSRGDDTVWFVKRNGDRKVFKGFFNARGVALDRGGNVWIVNSISDPTIHKIIKNGDSYNVDVDEAGLHRKVAVPYGSGAYGALVDSKGYLWVMDYSHTGLLRYDTSKWPQAVDPADVFLADGYGFTIDQDGILWTSGGYRIDTNSEPPAVATYPVGASANGIAFDINGNLWIGSDGSSVLKYNPKTGSPGVSYETGGAYVHGVAADDAGYVYTVNMSSNNVSKLNAGTGKIEKIFKVGNTPYTYSDLTGFIYRKVTLK